jgi:acetyltransferase-like isoleucine patch superfamily enzyme
VRFITAVHDHHHRGYLRYATVEREGRDIVLGEGVMVGSGATILGPCTIGDHAVIAAGAVVTADVLPGVVVGGIPARQIGPVIDFLS